MIINKTMKTLIAVAGLVCPIILNAGIWANLDDDHHYSGPKLTEKDLEGKVVLVDNWGVSCPPCRELLPRMQELWSRSDKQKFMLVGSHCQGKSPEQVKELVAANKLTFPIYEQFSLAEGTPKFKAIPFLYVVNHRGHVVYSGHDEREATKALKTAIADIGRPISLCSGVMLPGRYKSFAQKLRLGSSIDAEVRMLEKEAAGKNAHAAEEAKAILDVIAKTKKEVQDEISVASAKNPAEAVTLIKQFMKTWPKDGVKYKDKLTELQNQARVLP